MKSELFTAKELESLAKASKPNQRLLEGEEERPWDSQPAEKRRMQGCCYDCGRRYGEKYGFPDYIVPNDIWFLIAPNEGSGLLCSACICRRLYLAGIQTSGKFTSGPLCEQTQSPAEAVTDVATPVAVEAPAVVDEPVVDTTIV